MGNYLSISRYRFFVVLKPISVKLCIGTTISLTLSVGTCALWKNPVYRLLFSQGGGFLSAKANLVEKLSHIRGIQDGQSWMTRIILMAPVMGISVASLKAVPKGRFLLDREGRVGCRATDTNFMV